MEEKKLNILAIQMSSKIADKTANVINVRELIEKNYVANTDIIILPEVWTCGWNCEEFINSAEDINDSETINFLSEIAKKYNTNILGGSLILKKDNKYYNSCPIIGRTGNLVTTYDKNHLFSYYGCNEGTYVEHGTNPIMVTLDGIKIGLSICYDIRFPELYRSYAHKHADIMVNMAAWPMNREAHWDALTRARAIENQCFFVALTQSGLLNETDWNLGKSRILNYEGETISEILEGEGGVYAQINFDKMYEFRKKCTVLKDIQNSYNVREE